MTHVDKQSHHRGSTGLNQESGVYCPVDYSTSDSPSHSNGSLSYPTANTKEKKPTATMSCQVEDDELLAKTVATQTSDANLLDLEPRGRNPSENAEHLERLDQLGESFLRPTASKIELRGILRVPSAKWGSQSTVAFDEHVENENRRTSAMSDTSNITDLHGIQMRKAQHSVNDDASQSVVDSEEAVSVS